MFVFVAGFKEKEAEPTQNNVPKVLLTLNQVKKQLGPWCSDYEAKNIIEAHVPQKKLDRIAEATAGFSRIIGKGKSADYEMCSILSLLMDDKNLEFFEKNRGALTKIAAAVMHAEYPRSGGELDFSVAGILETITKEEKLHPLFKARPELFVRIAEGTGLGASFAFRDLTCQPIYAAFSKEPEKFAEAFSRIGKAVGAESFDAFSFSDYHVQKRGNDYETVNVGHPAALEFARNPSAFVMLAEKLKESTGPAFKLINNPAIRPFFSSHHETFARNLAVLSRAVGPGASKEAIGSLSSKELFEKLTSDSQNYISACSQLARFSGKQAASAFCALKEIPQLAHIFATEPAQIIQLAQVCKDSTGSALYMIGSNEEAMRAFKSDPARITGIFSKFIADTGGYPLAFFAMDSAERMHFFLRCPTTVSALVNAAKVKLPDKKDFTYPGEYWKADSDVRWEYSRSIDCIMNGVMEIEKQWLSTQKPNKARIFKDEFDLSPSPSFFSESHPMIFPDLRKYAGPGNTVDMLDKISRSQRSSSSTSGQGIFELFIKNPELYVSIAKGAGSDSLRAFDALSDVLDALASYVLDNPAAVGKGVTAIINSVPSTFRGESVADAYHDVASLLYLHQAQKKLLGNAPPLESYLGTYLASKKAGKSRILGFGKYQEPTMDIFINEFPKYNQMLSLLRSSGSATETFFLPNIRLEKVYSQIKDAKSYFEVMMRVKSLSPDLLRRMVNEFEPKKEWIPKISSINTPEDAMQAFTLFPVLDALSGKGGWWKKERERVLKILENPKAADLFVTSIPQASTLADLQKISIYLAPLESIFGEGKAAELVAKKVDFDRVFARALKGKFDISEVETARLMLNIYSKVLGDELIFMLGNAISSRPITQANLKERAEICKQFFASPSEYTDVNSLYGVLARFQLNKLAAFIKSNGQEKDWEDYFSENFAVELVKPGFMKKTWRSIRHPGYVATKAIDKLTPSKSLRPEIANATIVSKPGDRMPPGASCEAWSDKATGKAVATTIRATDPAKMRVTYMAEPGEGITSERLKGEFGDGVVAMAVASYSTGERKIAELAAQDGYIKSYLISAERDGLAIIYPDGRVSIKSSDNLKLSDLAPEKEDRALNIRDNQEDFFALINHVRHSEAGMFMGHLLVRGRKLDMDPDRSNPSVDKRRLFAIFKDGSSGIIDFEDHITLAEAGTLAIKMGAMQAINLDTGMYDYSSYKDSGGKLHQLGTFDSSNPTNLVLLVKK